MDVRYVLLLLVLLASIGGCTKTDAITDSGPIPDASQVIYVVNEGNYGKANASVTAYLPDSLKTYQDVFYSANNRSLGDVGNDLVIYGKYGYIVVNNSQKIEIVLLETMKSVGTITLPGSKGPFKAAIYSETKGYVTNLYDNSVTVFNPTTFAIVKERIPVGLNPQGILAFNGKIYVCNSGYGADSTISVIDPLTDAVVDRIVVGRSPSEIGYTQDGKLVVMCYGVTSYPDPAKESSGSIVCIDPSTLTVTKTLPLPFLVYDHPVKMAVSHQGDVYIKVMSGIMKVETTNMTVSNAVFIPSTSYGITGMTFDDANNRLYVADAMDFVSAATVSIYNAGGVLITSFTAGIIPGTIVCKSN